MPKFELKQVQRDLEKGQIWPVYWIYGPERMKSREILKRIRKAALGDLPEASSDGGLFGGGLSEERLDGTQVSAQEVVDAAQSLALGGGLRLIVVREAHALSGLDELGLLLGKPGPRESLTSVCVLLAKDLDGRKKFSKQLTEQAAVVECEAVADADRDPWIGYLAKARGLTLNDTELLELKARLSAIDPWSLDTVDSELEKWELARGAGLSPEEALESLQASAGAGSEVFTEAFFSRSGLQAMSAATEFAAQPEQTLPLLGLLAWNVRQLLQLRAASDGLSRAQVKVSPFLQEKLNRYARVWSLDELISLQAALFELDHAMKQTPKLPLGSWSSLVMEFCPLESGGGRTQDSSFGLR
jgi:DNA polymerase III delta subunit